MCGRFTRQYTWEQLHELYRLSVPMAGIPNLQPQYNVCPTDPADVVLPNDGARELVQMRWGLVPYWWSKPLKDLMRLSTFNARVETVTTKPHLEAARGLPRCLVVKAKGPKPTCLGISPVAGTGGGDAAGAASPCSIKTCPRPPRWRW